MLCYVHGIVVLFFFQQKTAFGWRISDWSSDVCSSDLRRKPGGPLPGAAARSPRRRSVPPRRSCVLSPGRPFRDPREMVIVAEAWRALRARLAGVVRRRIVQGREQPDEAGARRVGARRRHGRGGKSQREGGGGGARSVRGRRRK